MSKACLRYNAEIIETATRRSLHIAKQALGSILGLTVN